MMITKVDVKMFKELMGDSFTDNALEAIYKFTEGITEDIYVFDKQDICEKFTEYTKEELVETFRKRVSTDSEDFDILLDDLKDAFTVLEVGEDCYVLV